MVRKSLKILVLSSPSIKSGPAVIAEHYYRALRREGHEVDLMLCEPEKEHPEYLHAVEPGYRYKILPKLKRRFYSLISGLNTNSNYIFCYDKEVHPPIPVRKILNQINKQYNLILVVFWQHMLSFKTIDSLYEKLHCQFQFIGVDYSHMSGGCHFTGDCDNYKVGCGNCPAVIVNCKNDFTAWNVKYRRKVYEKVKPIVYGNQYMMNFYKHSFLLRDARCEILKSAIIDTDLFKPLNPVPLKAKYEIPDDKKFVIFFACQNLNDDRKGIKYLIKALLLFKELVDNNGSSVMVITAGKNYDNIRELIPFDSIGYGMVPINMLPELFSIASCFVCPSVNDAGPMMVNQSLCCATPVVGFEMGSVYELVKSTGAGISVPIKDSKALAMGLYEMYNMGKDQYHKMKVLARETALNSCSFKASADRIIDVYKKYDNNH